MLQVKDVYDDECYWVQYFQPAHSHAGLYVLNDVEHFVEIGEVMALRGAPIEVSVGRRLYYRRYHQVVFFFLVPGIKYCIF